MTDRAATTLPREIADRVTEPFARFLKIEAAAGGFLLLAVLIALLLANSPWSAPFERFWETEVGVGFGEADFSRSLRRWIDDGLMTFFFFVVALELKRELVLGELRNPRTAALPFAAALGGVVVPVCLYLAVMAGRPGVHGWGAVMATDTAFVIGALALFGSRIPPALRVFMLSLAVFDDIAAILVVALGYGEALNWTALSLAALGLGVVAGVAWLGIRNVAVYLMLGVVVWLFTDASGVHATVTGVALGLMTPARQWVSEIRLKAILDRLLVIRENKPEGDAAEHRGDRRLIGRAVRETVSPVERLETVLHPWVGFVVMPVFALANAGIPIDGSGLAHAVSAAIIAGLALGKPIGILGFSWLALRAGVAQRGDGLTWSFLAAGACLAGIGFTMSLFIAGLAFDPALMPAAKLGILAGSAVSATVGVALLLYAVSRTR